VLSFLCTVSFYHWKYSSVILWYVVKSEYRHSVLLWLTAIQVAFSMYIYIKKWSKCVCIYASQIFVKKIFSWELINNAQTCIDYSNFEYLELQIKDHRLLLERTQNTSIRKLNKTHGNSIVQHMLRNNKSELNSYWTDGSNCSGHLEADSKGAMQRVHRANKFQPLNTWLHQ